MRTQYSFQPGFRPALIAVNACANYAAYREELETIDDILRRSGLDEIMVGLALEKRRGSIPEDQERVCDLGRFLQHSLVAWRVRLLVPLLDSRAVRDVEKNLADSSLHQWFCHIGNFGTINSPSKSTIDRYKNWYDRDQLRQAFGILLQKAAADETRYDVALEEAVNILGFEMPSDLSEAWFDSTCLKPNIHFPVDWVLLTDVVRTLMKAVEKHARIHCALLENNREDSDLSEAQAAVVVSRIKGVIEKIPQAIKQAHDRIIGGRRVASADKLLSLYEPETKVIVRGKAGAEVEFGNKLLLGENREGLITCWALYDEVRNDDKLLEEALSLTSENTGMPVKLMCGDRGFSNEATQRILAEDDPARKDHVASKSVVKFNEQMKDAEFRESQQRRAQTEGRVGIIKNVFMSGRSLSKGMDSRRQELAWITLSHNLRVLACKRIAEKQARENRREALAKTG